MPHILISYKDNPSFSLYTTKLSREGEKQLNNKNWIGFNAKGEEQYYANNFGVNHILIQDCSQDELNAAITAHPIQYRIVEDSELTKNTDLLFNPCKLRLNISKILSRDAHILKAVCEVENKNINEQSSNNTDKEFNSCVKPRQMEAFRLFTLQTHQSFLTDQSKVQDQKNGSEQKANKNTDMKSINTYQDAEQFAGRFVAFKTKSHYFASGQGYKVSDSDLRFALVSDYVSNYRGGLGYSMSVLLNLNDTPSANVMLNSMLKNANMMMRLASTEELNRIKTVVADEEANFEYTFDKHHVIKQLDSAIKQLECIRIGASI